MALFGTDSAIASDILILGEIVLTVLVYIGVRSIRKDRQGHVSNHRTIMLTVLVFNLLLLVFFVIMDLIAASNTIERGGTNAPLWLFIPLLIIHLAIAISALTIAIRAWLSARKGTIRDGKGVVVNVTPDVRQKHRAISRYYPPMWYATLVSGLLLYAVLYLIPY